MLLLPLYWYRHSSVTYMSFLIPNFSKRPIKRMAQSASPPLERAPQCAPAGSYAPLLPSIHPFPSPTPLLLPNPPPFLSLLSFSNKMTTTRPMRKMPNLAALPQGEGLWYHKPLSHTISLLPSPAQGTARTFPYVASDLPTASYHGSAVKPTISDGLR